MHTEQGRGRVRTEELLDGDADRAAAAPDANHVVRTETVIKYLPCEAVRVHEELVRVDEHLLAHACGKERGRRRRASQSRRLARNDATRFGYPGGDDTTREALRTIRKASGRSCTGRRAPLYSLCKLVAVCALSGWPARGCLQAPHGEENTTATWQESSLAPRAE